MNCPHCQKPLPENYAASFCLHCGGAVKSEQPINVDLPLAPVKINWLVFFGVMLAPALLTLLVALLNSGQRNEQISPWIALIGGATSGIACGIMLALRLSKSREARVFLGLLFAMVFAVVCIMLSFFGCMIGGYQLRLD